jgi:acyl-CoA hydrolase
MAEIMEPQHANFLSKVFGGVILAKIDLCAYYVASRFAQATSVTASFDRVDFHQPIEVGELVTFIGFVSFVGRTSIEVTIEVYTDSIFGGERRHTNTARVTMVALKDNRPTEVPRLICETREDKVRYLEGKFRRELRSRQRDESIRLNESVTEATDEELDAMLAKENV